MRDLKTHLHRTIHRHRKSVEQIADDLGISSSYLYRSALPCDGETATGCRFPLDLLIPLVRSTGDYQVLDYVEAALGRAAVTLPNVGEVDAEEAGASLCRVIEEFSDVTREGASALKDGTVTRQEVERVRFETEELILAALTFVSAMEAAAK